MRTEEEASDDYWKTLKKIGKFNNPKLSKLRKEITEIKNYNNDLTNSQYNHSEKDTLTNGKVAIKRGCPNKECFCTGKCNEIIGYRDKLFNEY